MDDAGADRFWPLFWAMAPAEVLSAIGASDVRLGGAEAAVRLERFGPNRSVLPSGRRFIQRLLRRLIEPLIAVLIVAALLLYVTGDVASMIIILGFSVGMDLFQEAARRPPPRRCAALSPSRPARCATARKPPSPRKRWCPAM